MAHNRTKSEHHEKNDKRKLRIYNERRSEQDAEMMSIGNLPVKLIDRRKINTREGCINNENWTEFRVF